MLSSFFFVLPTLTTYPHPSGVGCAWCVLTDWTASQFSYQSLLHALSGEGCAEFFQMSLTSSSSVFEPSLVLLPTSETVMKCSSTPTQNCTLFALYTNQKKEFSRQLLGLRNVDIEGERWCWWQGRWWRRGEWSEQTGTTNCDKQKGIILGEGPPSINKFGGIPHYS